MLTEFVGFCKGVLWLEAFWNYLNNLQHLIARWNMRVRSHTFMTRCEDDCPGVGIEIADEFCTESLW